MYAYFNFRTLIRFGIIFILTVVLAAYIPAFPSPDVLVYLSPIPVATIFAIVIAFYINDAITRMKNLEASIAIELSRARRVYHLAAGFSSTAGLKKWAQKMRDLDIVYMQSFSSNDFDEYSKGNTKFRELSHHIYQMDAKLLKLPKEIALYEELLTTTREWAMVRQNIQELKKQKISLYSWVILLSISIILIFFLMLLRTQGIFSTKLVSGLSIIAVLFTLDLLWEINSLSRPERIILARKYLFNIDKLQMDVPEGEKRK